MKKIFSFILAVLFTLSFAACSGTQTGVYESSGGDANTSVPNQMTASNGAGVAPERSKILVVYFSRTGEQYNVGVIDEGNTAVVAKAIAAGSGADTFEILPETDYYPYTYKELTDVAKQEQTERKRPRIKGTLPDLSGYETIFIGAPVWWGDWPMIMYTFFENADLSGKNLVPFSTHEGSGLSGFDKKLASAVPGAHLLTGLAIRGTDCRKDRSAVEKKVSDWLNSLGY